MLPSPLRLRRRTTTAAARSSSSGVSSVSSVTATAVSATAVAISAIVIIIAGASLDRVAAAATCPTPTMACGDACYDPARYVCLNGASLCPAGSSLCGTACYYPAVHTCANGVLGPAATNGGGPAQAPAPVPVPAPAPDTTSSSVATSVTPSATPAPPSPPAAGAYTLVDTFAGPNFFDNFDFFSAADPTHGTVQYVSQQDATAQGLISAGFPTTISADARNVQPEGRHSVRISSKKSYTSGLFLFDITHMPAGCGTWPAVWMLGPNWPTGGELDILENVNLETLNHVTLHTSAGCALDTAAQVQTGTTLTTMCESPGTNSNAGCGVQAAAAGAYGAAFNAAGGGVYAAEWTAAGFKVWFFPRATIPADVAAGMGLSPAKWGTPMAHMPFGAACSADHFKSMQIIINLTFCGDWAGALYGPGCPAPTGNAGCQSFVVNNPAAFNQSYWSINSIKTFAAM